VSAEFIKIVTAHWQGGFGLAAIKNPASQFTGCRVVCSESKQSVRKEPQYSLSLLELVEAPSPREDPGFRWRWMVLHWLGDRANLKRHSWEAAQLGNPELSETDAREQFELWQATWRKHGRMFPNGPTGFETAPSKSNKLPPLTPDECRVEEEKRRQRRICKARLEVLAKSFPLTVKSKSIEAFKYEIASARPDIDPIDYELVMNSGEYENLSWDEIAKRISAKTGVPIKPDALKKRPVAQAIFPSRQPGPRPQS
jgi:hypothetical protein